MNHEWLVWGAFTIVLLFALVVLRGAPYIPSHKRDVKRAFRELYPISDRDVLVDIGSGDGVVVRAAAAQGARAIGYEINPILVLVSRLLSTGLPRVQTKWEDFWRAKLPSEVTVVYVFGGSRYIKKMAKFVDNESKRLEKSIWLISYGIEIPNLEPEKAVGAHFLYKL